jgi:hypothetical protein
VVKNLAEQVEAEAEGTKFGAAPADVARMKAMAEGLLARLEATNALAAALKGARQAEAAEERAMLPKMRALVRHWKTLPGYPASGSEAALRLKVAGPTLDPATYKPVIRARIEAGRVRLDFEKRGVSGLVFYARLRGAMEWERLGTDTRAPFWDARPLAQPGAPEVREYMARGLVNDDEIGLDSDIVSVTFGGVAPMPFGNAPFGNASFAPSFCHHRWKAAEGCRIVR